MPLEVYLDEISVGPPEYRGNNAYEGWVNTEYGYNASIGPLALQRYAANAVVMISKAYNNGEWTTSGIDWIRSEWGQGLPMDVLYDAAVREAMKYVYNLNSWQTALFDPATYGITTPSTHLSGGYHSAFAALYHYAEGSGAPMSMDIGDIGLNVQARDIKALRTLISSATTPGTYHVDSNFAYSTAKDSLSAGAYLGNITLHAVGDFTRNGDGSWSYSGSITAYPDIYDANPSSHREWYAEMSTSVLGSIPGVQYTININGTIQQSFSGTGAPAQQSIKYGNSFYTPAYTPDSNVAVSDILQSSSGSDILIGRQGNDRYTVYGAADSVQENPARDWTQYLPLSTTACLRTSRICI